MGLVSFSRLSCEYNRIEDDIAMSSLIYLIISFLTVGYPIGLSSYDTASRSFLLCKTPV